MAKRNIKLTIQYDGYDYHGWQVQPGYKTVQAILNKAIAELIGQKVHATAASRTDAGVSALGQVAIIQIDSAIPTENLAKAITDRLPEDIAVTQAEELPNGFDIIGAVKSKLYRYTIFTGPTRPVLDIRRCWHIPATLDLEAMNKAAQYLVGQHDFKSFASAKDNRETSVRTIFRCEATVIPAQAGIHNSQNAQRTTQNDWIYVDVEGNSFLYNMVRNMVGSLVEVGLGRWQPDKMQQVLEAKDRRAAGPIAPPQGLCLMKIDY